MNKEIEAAVGWWKQALSSFVFQDNGDPLQTAMATWRRDRQPKPTPQQLDDFASAMTALLTASLRDGWDKAKADPNWGCATEGRSLYVDYGPSGILLMAAEMAGIRYGTTLFPIKTSMHINPGKVTAKQGYGAPDKVIYEEGK